MAQYEAIRNLESMTTSPNLSKSTIVGFHQGQTINDVDIASVPSCPKPGPPPADPALVGFIPSDPTTRPSNKHWCYRIGYTGLITLFVGYFVILAVCAFLIFLWGGVGAAKDGNSPVFWETIVFRGWATRAVTICSAALRTSIGFQIGLITTAIAAIMLESVGVRFRDTAQLSIQRAVGFSPHGILLAAQRQCTVNKLLGSLHLFVIAAALLVTLASAFFSTILLSDFQMRDITAPSTTRTLAVGIKSEPDLSPDYQPLPVTGASYWKSRPLANWRFAETRRGKPISAHGVVDTGNVYRAMLPFESELSRTSLQYYSGPAIVTNFRTACVGPKFAALRLEYGFKDSVDGNVYLNGSIHANISGIGRIENGPPEWPVDYFCQLQNNWDESDTSVWPLTLCDSPISDASNMDGPRDPLSHRPYTTHAFLLLNSKAPLNGLTATYDPYTGMTPPKMSQLRNLTSKQQGSWTHAYARNGSEVFSASLCFINQGLPQMYNVTMTGRTISSEPSVDWYRRVDAENKTRIFQQLGVGLRPQDIEDRGILDLEIRSRAIAYTQADKESSGGSYDYLLYNAISEYIARNGWSMRFDNLTTPETSPHPAHASVFQAILGKTQDPALALQSLVFRFYQMIYYDWYQSFDLLHPVTTTHSAEMLIPAQWTGLVIVLCSVCLHLGLVLLAVLLFALRTKTSLLGNAWQAVSQMVSPQTAEVMEAADLMRDKDVRNWAGSTGLYEGVYGISRSADGGRTEVQKQHWE